MLGGSNYLGTVIWQKADGPRNDLPNFSVDHDTIHVYGRSEQTKLNLNDRDKALNSIYSAIDGDDKPWYDDNPTAPSAHRNQTWVYGIQSPVTGELQYPARGRCWASKQDTVFTSLLEYADYELKVIDDDDLRAGICGVSAAEVRKGIPAIVLAGSLEDARKSVDRRKQAGPWPEFIIRSKGTIGRKRYQPTTGTNTRRCGSTATSDTTERQKREIKALFPGETPFATPKPERLLRRVIEVASGPGDIVLDCFAGSGTTAAVAHKTGRRWVTVERERRTVDTFTNPRLTKVVNGKDLGGITTVTRLIGEGLPEMDSSRETPRGGQDPQCDVRRRRQTRPELMGRR